jgi:rRNA maturation protein Nop10
MTDEEFYSFKICPNCKHNTIENAKLYTLEGKGKCWTCGEEMKNFTRSEFSKQKMKEFGVEE